MVGCARPRNGSNDERTAEESQDAISNRRM
jgi:hypothetical protein